MRLVQYTAPSDNRLSVGILDADGSVVPVTALSDIGPVGSMIELMERCDRGEMTLDRLAKAAAAYGGSRLALEAVHLSAPVIKPPKFFAIAINGKANWERSIKPANPKPQYFIKLSTCITGPYDPIELPDIGSVGPEVEMAAIIGRGGKHIPVEEARGHIFGFTIHNDLTAHDLRINSEWIRLRRKDGSEEQLTYPGRWKNFDTFSPMGPWLITTDEVGDPHDYRLWTRLNGELVQEGHSSDVAFTVDELVAYLSRAHTLEVGDIISLGTVPAVAPWTMAGMDMRHYGGVVEAGIDGFGALRNPIKPV